MKYAQKRFVSIFIYLFFALLSVLLTATFAKSSHIIYEYETITQEKGESFDKALQKTQLNAKQIALVKQIPIVKEARSARTFRFIYVISNHRYLLREVKISRNKKTLSYVLSQQGGLRFIKGYSNIPKESLSQRKGQTSQKKSLKEVTPKKVIPEKLSVKKKNILPASITLTALVVVQDKGQTIEKALIPAKLSKLQNRIILSGRYRKNALSTRQLKLFFENKGHERLLRGLSIIRGKEQVDYLVKKYRNDFRLVPLVRLKSVERKETQQQFSSASVTVIEEKTSEKDIDKKQNRTGQKTSRPDESKQTAKHSDSYMALSFTQKKGQSLSSALRQVQLSHLQRGLINKMPATKSAKTTRKVHLLFQKQQGNKYLRAMRIVRNGRIAEYVLVKYQGQWVWANERGQVFVKEGKARKVGRYPLRYQRISSGFNLRRRHPITHRIRPHKGIDLAAPHGTPIYAPARGIVEFAGRQRGYGIIVIINHQNGYKTKYAHLSRIARGIRRGVTVESGKFIARVGSTGHSTGPHLHYEVLINGRPRNPAYVRVPNGRSGVGATKTLKSAKADANVYLPKLRALTR